MRQDPADQRHTARAKPPLARNRDWQLFMAGRSISNVGDYVFAVTVLLWVTQTIAKGEPWAPAAGTAVLIAALAPALFLGPFAGVFVDRWDRRRVMLVSDAARAFAMAALVPLAFPSVADHVPRPLLLAVVYAVVAAAACFSQFFNPASFAILGQLVDEADIPRASGLAATSSYTAAIIGPPIAAPLLYTAGPQWALAINAISFVISYITIRLLRLGGAVAAGGSPDDAGTAGYWTEFRTGIAYFAATPVLVALAAGLFVAVLGAGVLGALNVFFIQSNLHSTASMYGTLGLAEGLGGVLGALGAAWLMARLGASRVFCLGLTLAGLGVIGYSRMTALPPALVFIAIVGALSGAVDAAFQPLVLAVTPPEFIGRIVSAIGPAISAAGVLSLAVSGTLASTVLSGFHADIGGISFGPYDTIFGVGGVLFVASGITAGFFIRGRTEAGEAGAPRRTV